ncbi:hypothetical protein E2C01_102198 [Portunus trituberculatus]|uniref:Uncharacterized protein n=1 Tax=Portunus trituberculatus TaxID=210409 RepID=A0A5B7KM77_PORTR|nr:hypothetical protein [Portunus trituberculatus]
MEESGWRGVGCRSGVEPVAIGPVSAEARGGAEGGRAQRRRGRQELLHFLGRPQSPITPSLRPL